MPESHRRRLTSEMWLLESRGCGSSTPEGYRPIRNTRLRVTSSTRRGGTPASLPSQAAAPRLRKLSQGPGPEARESRVGSWGSGASASEGHLFSASAGAAAMATRQTSAARLCAPPPRRYSGQSLSKAPPPRVRSIESNGSTVQSGNGTRRWSCGP